MTGKDWAQVLKYLPFKTSPDALWLRENLRRIPSRPRKVQPISFVRAAIRSTSFPSTLSVRTDPPVLIAAFLFCDQRKTEKASNAFAVCTGQLCPMASGAGNSTVPLQPKSQSAVAIMLRAAETSEDVKEVSVC